MYKVFINEYPLLILNMHEVTNYSNLHKYSNLDEGVNINDVRKMIKDNTFNKPVLLVVENSELALDKIFKKHKYIEAAGGVVENRQGKFLAIKRLGKWDWPKGKIEKGESPKEAAVREIEEECNISSPKVDHKICETLHAYNLYGKRWLKRTYWYKLSYKGNEKLVPQVEEQITKVKWIGKKGMKRFESNTYETLIDVNKVLVSLF